VRRKEEIEMKKLDESSLGGRIRKCRIESAQGIKALAEKVGVSANYLGLVERGEKNPSRGLLKEIAEVTGVSLKWLQTGEADAADATDTAILLNKKDSLPVYTANVNPQLILALALRSPSMTKETLAALLMVPVETIDKILTGGTVDFDPRWGNVFPILVQNLDIRSIRQELKTLDAFLAKEEENVNRMKLLEILKNYVNEKAGAEERPTLEYKIAGPIESRAEAYDTEGGGSLSMMVSRMMLECRDKQDFKWYFAYFPFVDSVSKDTVEEIFKETLDGSISAPDVGSASIVVSSRTAFEKFSVCADAYLNERNMWQHVPDGSIGDSAFPKFFSIILIDADNMTVVDEEVCEDKEYEAAIKESCEWQAKNMP